MSRYGQDARPPGSVVVIGGSLAGLFAAAAASGAGCAVTVLERDVLPSAPAPRRGVPQDRHPHVFLYRGLLAAEELLPGLRGDLIAAGALPMDTGDVPWRGEHGWLPVGRPAFEILSLTRPLLEDVVRRRVRALPGVQIRDGVQVTGVRRTASGPSRPLGDASREAPASPPAAAWRVELAGGDGMDAELVIDASGRSSRLPVWLAEAGVASQRTTEIDAKVGYATRFYRPPPEPVAGTTGAPSLAAPARAPIRSPGVVIQATPVSRAGALALRVQDGLWQVGAVGHGDRRPPRDADGFGEFVAGLPDPAVADIVRRLEPVGDIVVHRQTGNRRHHYERLRDWPDGLLVVGDALCAFNPLYGQGITVAACEAVLVRRALEGPLSPGYSRRLMRQFAGVIALPWAVATGEDLRFPTSGGRQSPPQRMLGWWTRELALLVRHGNTRAQDAFSRVYHLMGSPALLFHPLLVGAVLRARLTGYGPPAPRPPDLVALSSDG